MTAPYLSGISPFYKGQTGPIWQIQLQDTNGNPPPALTSCVFVLYIYSATNSTPPRLGTGTFAIVNANLGTITYTWAAADTSIVGKFSLQVQCTYPGGGGLVYIYDPVPWEVINLPVPG
jgi:hypothetical protein